MAVGPTSGMGEQLAVDELALLLAVTAASCFRNVSRAGGSAADATDAAGTATKVVSAPATPAPAAIWPIAVGPAPKHLRL